jgi:hypothetical protein
MPLKLPEKEMTPSEEEEKEPIVSKYEELFNSYQNTRSKYTRQWYINDNFFDGNHFIFFRKSTGTIEVQFTDQFLKPVNKLKQSKTLSLLTTHAG